MSERPQSRLNLPIISCLRKYIRTEVNRSPSHRQHQGSRKRTGIIKRKCILSIIICRLKMYSRIKLKWLQNQECYFSMKALHTAHTHAPPPPPLSLFVCVCVCVCVCVWLCLCVCARAPYVCLSVYSVLDRKYGVYWISFPR